MKLIRLSTDDSNSLFFASFNDIIEIEPNSKICLSSLTTEESINNLIIDDTNDLVNIQLINGIIKQIKLNHNQYTGNNIDLFFNDFSDKLNRTLKANGKGLGYEYKVQLDNTGRFSVIGLQSSVEVPRTDWTTNSVNVNSTGVFNSSVLTPTTINNVNMGLNNLWCNGGAVFSCRIDTLIDEATEDESGFIMGLTETPAVDKPNYSTGIIRHGIRIDTVGGVYSYYNEGAEVITSVSVEYEGEGNITNDTLQIQLTEGKYTYVIYNNSNPNGVILFENDKKDYDSNDLYPFIAFRGSRDNVKVNAVRYTVSPHNANPVENIITLTNDETTFSVPKATTTPTAQFIQFLSIRLAKYLGFTNQTIPSTIPVPVVTGLSAVADNQFVPTSFSDAFLVELLNLSVNSYDSSVSGRRNLLAVVPQSYNDKQQIVYEAPFPIWIDLLNAFKIDLRELKIRLLRNDNTPLVIKGIATAVILIKTSTE
jgi:hypothetical protein